MTEEWRDIAGYEGIYQVSNFGRIKSLCGWNGHEYIKREKILTGWIQVPNKKYPYKRVRIGLTKDKKVKYFMSHRLVAQAFVPNPNNYDVVNHIDFDSTNNHADNLEWVTFEQNILYSREHDRFLKIQKGEYKNIVDMYINGDSSLKIAKRYGVNHSTILRILHQNRISTNKTYSKYNIDLNELLVDIQNGMKNMDLSKKYNCSTDIIATRKKEFKKKGLLK